MVVALYVALTYTLLQLLENPSYERSDEMETVIRYTTYEELIYRHTDIYMHVGVANGASLRWNSLHTY